MTWSRQKVPMLILQEELLARRTRTISLYRTSLTARSLALQRRTRWPGLIQAHRTAVIKKEEHEVLIALADGGQRVRVSPL